MNAFWKTTAFLGSILAAAGTIRADAPRERKLSSEERAALQSVARQEVLEFLDEHAVRTVASNVKQADAQRIATALTEEQLLQLAAGTLDLAEVVTSTSVRVATAPALGDAGSDLLFVPISPCRIIDTRKTGPLTGPLAPGVVRDFYVTGNANFPQQGGEVGGCGVPDGAATPLAPAVVVNFVAVGPAGPGHLEAWEYGQPVPNASVINYSNVPGLNIANGVVVPIDGTSLHPFDLHVRANVSGTHLVADVTGYFTRFPDETIEAGEKSITVVSDGGAVDMSNSDAEVGGVCPVGKKCCYQVNSCTLTSSSPGKAIIRGWAKVSVNHTAGSPGGDRIIIGTVPAGAGGGPVNEAKNCQNSDQSIDASDFEVPEPHGTDASIDSVLSHKRILNHTAGTRTYHMNGKVVTGASAGDGVVASRLICTFIPD